MLGIELGNFWKSSQKMSFLLVVVDRLAKTFTNLLYYKIYYNAHQEHFHKNMRMMCKGKWEKWYFSMNIYHLSLVDAMQGSNWGTIKFLAKDLL